MNLMNVVKNVVPAIAVMIAGLGGAYLVYETYFSDNFTAARVTAYEPAAGDETLGASLGESFTVIEPAAGDDAAIAVEEGGETIEYAIDPEAEGDVTFEEVNDLIENSIDN